MTYLPGGFGRFFSFLMRYLVSVFTASGSEVGGRFRSVSSFAFTVGRLVDVFEGGGFGRLGREGGRGRAMRDEVFVVSCGSLGGSVFRLSAEPVDSSSPFGGGGAGALVASSVAFSSGVSAVGSGSLFVVSASLFAECWIGSKFLIFGFGRRASSVTDGLKVRFTARNRLSAMAGMSMTLVS